MTAGIRSAGLPADRTVVELTWREKQIEHWIRFGRSAEDQRLGAIIAGIRSRNGGVCRRSDLIAAGLAADEVDRLALPALEHAEHLARQALQRSYPWGQR